VGVVPAAVVGVMGDAPFRFSKVGWLVRNSARQSTGKEAASSSWLPVNPSIERETARGDDGPTFVLFPRVGEALVWRRTTGLVGLFGAPGESPRERPLPPVVIHQGCVCKRFTSWGLDFLGEGPPALMTFRPTDGQLAISSCSFAISIRSSSQEYSWSLDAFTSAST